MAETDLKSNLVPENSSYHQHMVYHNTHFHRTVCILRENIHITISSCKEDLVLNLEGGGGGIKENDTGILVCGAHREKKAVLFLWFWIS